MIKVYEVILDEDNLDGGINAISLVSSPAIDSNFIALSKEEKGEIQLKAIEGDRQILVGAALIPNKPIYRKVGEEEFYIIFSKDTIRRASELYFMRNNQNNTTLEHENKLTGLTTVESWIVENVEMDKSKHLGLSVPVGTWMVTLKVEDDKIWNQLIKTEEVKGFSIEGYFVPELREKLSKVEINEYDSKINEVKKILKLI
jgi:hypothetical protein